MLRNLVCLRPLAAMLTLCFATDVAKADDFLAPNWTAGGAFTNRGTTKPAPPTFSNDGSKILYLQNLTVTRTGHVQGAISVYNTIWQCIDQISLISTTIDSACFAYDSSAFFYSSVTPDQQSTTIWRHELATRAEKSLKVREFSPITLMATSPDGTYLAYYVPGTGKVSIYNFATNKVTAQIAQATSSLAFLGNTGKIVLSGPTIYDSSGIKKGGIDNAANPVAVSPDGKTLVTLKSSTSKLTAYNAATLSENWSKSIPTPYSTLSPIVSGDNRNVLLPGATKGLWSVLALSVFTGEALPKSISSPQPLDTKGILPLLAVSPNKNRLVLGPSTVPNSEDWAIDPTNGGGAKVGTFFSSAYSGLGSVTFPIAAGDQPAFVTTDTASSVLNWAVLDALTGGSLAVFSKDLVLSRDLRYYAVFPYDGTVKIYSTVDNKLRADYKGPKASQFKWGQTSKTFWILRIGTDHYEIDLFAYDGNKTIKKTSTVKVSGFRDAIISPEGSRLVVNYGTYASVFNCLTGATVGTISQSTNSGYGLHDLSFTTNGLLCVNEFITGSNPINLCRVLDPRGDSVKSSYQLQRNISGGKPSDPFDGAVSPNGQYLAFYNLTTTGNGNDLRVNSEVALVRVKDGYVVRNWKNQFGTTDDGMGGQIVFSANSSTLAWQSLDDGTIVAANVPRVLTSATAQPSSVPGGGSTTGTIVLDDVVAQDTIITLSSSAANIVVPTTVVVRAGQKSATFPIKTLGVDKTSTFVVKVTHENLTVNLTLTVQATSALTHTVNPVSVEAGWDAVGMVTLDAETGPGGLVVELVPSGNGLVTIPVSKLMFPANTKAISYLINTPTKSSNEKVEINAKAPGFSGGTNLSLTKTAPVLASLDKASVPGGQSVKLTLTLDQIAPNAGFPLKLTSDSTSVLPPAAVTVGAATRSVTITVPTSAVKGKQTAVITVSSGAIKLGTVQLTVTP